MKILVVGPSWVGDMVMAQALFITLKQCHLHCKIEVLAPAWSAPILACMPEVAKSIALPFGHGDLQLRKRYQLGKKLRAERYEQAILLPNSFKSALIPYWARIPLRTGWLGECRYGLINDFRKLDRARYGLMIERFIALAYPPNTPLPKCLPRPKLRVDPKRVQSTLRAFALDLVRPILLLAPGAEFGVAKCWPERYFAEVATNRVRKGWQVWICGSANDRPTSARIMRQVATDCRQYCMDLVGRTRLFEVVDLISATTAVVSNDSGLMHIAAALERPLVVMYGPTSPYFTPPLHSCKKILKLDLPCSPCFARTCPLGHHNCMQQLTSDMVIRALDQLLENNI